MEEEISLFVPGRLGMLGELSDLVSDYLSINLSLIPGETIATGISKGIYAVAKKSKIFRFSYNNDSIELEMDTKKLDKVAKGNNFFLMLFQ